jgi:hypothetical protein
VRLYPGRSYDVRIELGGTKLRTIILAELHVRSLAEQLPAMCAEMCNDKLYRCQNGDFRRYTTIGYRTAKLRLGDIYII